MYKLYMMPKGFFAFYLIDSLCIQRHFYDLYRITPILIQGRVILNIITTSHITQTQTVDDVTDNTDVFYVVSCE